MKCFLEGLIVFDLDMHVAGISEEIREFTFNLKE